jgi:hypothetical protein
MTMNCKGFGRKRSWPSRGAILECAWTEENNVKPESRRPMSQLKFEWYRARALPLDQPVGWSGFESGAISKYVTH